MFEIAHSGYGARQLVRLRDIGASTSATIAVGYGFNCFSFIAPAGGRSHDFLYAAASFPSPSDRAAHHGTPILAPFPNRIRSGSFSYSGRRYQVDCNEAGKNAIHGLVIDQPWRVRAEGTSPVDGAWITGEFELAKDKPDRLAEWPEDFTLSVTYRLRGAVLRADIEIENSGRRPQPFGFGIHPYFRIPFAPAGFAEECEIVAPLTTRIDLIDCLPTGTQAPANGEWDLSAGQVLGGRKFDDVFGGPVAQDEALTYAIRDPAAGGEFQLRCCPDFRFGVVYVPPHRQAICLEPYTCVTDAVNLSAPEYDTGLWNLQPGERRPLWFEYEAASCA